MKAHLFERACPLYQEGAIRPIFEGDMPPKQMTPKSGAVNGTITGILLMLCCDDDVESENYHGLDSSRDT
jgi:hypothetical protein